MMEEAPRECWYRVVDGRFAPPVDEWDRPIGHGRAYVTMR